MSRQIYTSARILPTLLLGALFSLRTPPAQAPPLFQIATSQPGVYRVTYEALVVAGLSDQPVPSEMLSLSHRGTPVPIWIQKGHNTRDGQFGPGDWFEFDNLPPIPPAGTIARTLIEKAIGKTSQ